MSRFIAESILPNKEFSVNDCPACAKSLNATKTFKLFANSNGTLGSASIFLPPPPATAKYVVVDYAIHSDEATTGWLGTVFNDYWEVSITCGVKGVPPPPFVGASGTIGQVSFDGMGTTKCFRLELGLSGVESKICSVGVSIADAIDPLLHSSICAKVYFC